MSEQEEGAESITWRLGDSNIEYVIKIYYRLLRSSDSVYSLVGVRVQLYYLGNIASLLVHVDGS